MSNTQTPEWEKRFDEQFDRFPDSYYNFVVGKDGTKWENTASDLNDFKAFISQQLTAFSKEVEEAVMMLFVEVDVGGQVTMKKAITEQEVSQALSKVNKDWGIK